MNDNINIVQKLSDSIEETKKIDLDLFKKNNVKRGLRNDDHSGVLVGLTKVGNVVGYQKSTDGQLEPTKGKLYFRGINVKALVKGCQYENRYAFEEAVFLLLSGKLPLKDELDAFYKHLATQRQLSDTLKMSILEIKGNDIMNVLARSVMVMYSKDQLADNVTGPNVMKQSLNLIAKFPTIIAYAYHTMRHQYYNETLAIRHPQAEMSMAENFLYMLKGEGNYTRLDVRVLDLALVMHAEHGGGNNSTFTTRVTSSAGTDTYSAITAAIGSLKGFLHGGANLQVMDMFEHLKENIGNWEDETEVKQYLLRMLNKDAYNKSGKIYGIGHAVYTLSDPRAEMLKEMGRELAEEKGRSKEFAFLENIERLAIETFMEFKGKSVGKSVCANVDLYSGFVYNLIGLPKEIYTPLFAMSRIAGWCAHRIEELNYIGKRIIRPAYKNVMEEQTFTCLDIRGTEDDY